MLENVDLKLRAVVERLTWSPDWLTSLIIFAAALIVALPVSAGTAGRVFDLRCEVREKMIAWLQDQHPQALPRRRAEFDAGTADKADGVQII